MEISKDAILEKTHYGIKIYAHVLRKYYPRMAVLSVSGRECQPAKNPWNNNKPTLRISIEDNVAVHVDTDRAQYKGDVFDFAAMHYKLEDQALYQRLNKEMGLGIGEPVSYYNSAEKVIRDPNPQNPQNPRNPHSTNFEQNVKKRKVQVPKFSLFKKPIQNTEPVGHGSLVAVYQLIKGTGYERATCKLRVIQDKQAARKYKERNFDYATFSGIFSKRENDALVRHSGLFAVDFDHVPDVEGLRQRLLQDPYFETELLFVSPSGDGLKWIIPIDIRKASHQVYAQAIGKYVEETYGEKMDPSGKDVARACFLPHDPDIYINPKYIKHTPPAPKGEHQRCKA